KAMSVLSITRIEGRREIDTVVRNYRRHLIFGALRQRKGIAIPLCTVGYAIESGEFVVTTWTLVVVRPVRIRLSKAIYLMPAGRRSDSHRRVGFRRAGTALRVDFVAA